MANREIINKIVDAYNRHDAEAIASLNAPDATAYDPQYSAPLRGRDAIRKDMEDFFTTLPDTRATVSNVLVDGDKMACEMVMTGTHKGPLVTPEGSIPPTDKRVEIRAAIFFSVNSQGLITENNRYYDLAGFLEQVGVH